MVCQVFLQPGHHTDICSAVQDDEEVKAVEGFQSNQKVNDPYAPTYNPRWNDHPNLRYGKNQQGIRMRIGISSQLISKLNLHPLDSLN